MRRLIRDQRVLFLVVGAMNTAFSTSLFAALVLCFGDRVAASALVVVAWSAAVLVFFPIYRYFVFRVRGSFFMDLARFCAVNIMGLLLTTGAVAVFVDLAGLPAIPVQIATTLVVIVFNYLAHKNFSFRRKSRTS